MLIFAGFRLPPDITPPIFCLMLFAILRVISFHAAAAVID